MCTVTFFPLKDRVVLTSNRDEKTNRPTHSPKIYQFDGTKLLFPKDKQAGGTWFVAKEDGTVIILLNGAFENHRKKIGSAKSRGVVLLEVIKAKNPLKFYKKMNLEGVEPFTLIYYYENKLGNNFLVIRISLIISFLLSMTLISIGYSYEVFYIIAIGIFISLMECYESNKTAEQMLINCKQYLRRYEK